MLDILYCTLIYIGTIIGAGFASGKEIQEFFGHPFGFIFIVISFILFIFINLRLFSYIFDNKISDYHSLLEMKCPKSKILFHITSILFSVLSYGIMCSGVNSTLNEYYISNGGLYFSAVCIIFFIFEIRGLAALNLFVTPLIILGILLISIQKREVFNNYTVSAIKYCSYNTLSCLPVLPSLLVFFKTRKKAVLSAVVSSIMLFLLMTCVYFSLPITSVDIPMLYSAKSAGLQTIYTPVLLLAMLTTATANGYSYICCFKGHKYLHILTLFLVSLIMISINFSLLIKYIFNAFGIVSFFLLVFLLK